MNEIKWDKFIKSCENSQNSEKFIKNIKNLLDESLFDKKSDDIYNQIDELLRDMTEDEVKEVKNMISELLLQEFEPYQDKMRQQHPKFKEKMLAKGSEKAKSTPYNKTMSTKNGKSGI